MGVVKHEGVARAGVYNPIACVELRHVRQQFGALSRSADDGDVGDIARIAIRVDQDGPGRVAMVRLSRCGLAPRPQAALFEHVDHVIGTFDDVCLGLLRNHGCGLAVVAIATVGLNGSSYIFKTFSLSYLAEFRNVPGTVGALGISLASAVAPVVIPWQAGCATLWVPGE